MNQPVEESDEVNEKGKQGEVGAKAVEKEVTENGDDEKPQNDPTDNGKDPDKF